MLLSAAMATVDIHVKTVGSHQPGVLSDSQNQLVHVTAWEQSLCCLKSQEFSHLV